VREVGRRDGGWRVLVDSAVGTVEGPEEFAAAAVVLAVPGAVAAPLIARATDGSALLPVAPPSHVCIVTLIVDAPELDSAPRGSGLLVAPGVSDVAAKALTHATAKWRWLAEQAGPHRHVLRLSYGRGRGPADGPDTDTGAGMVDLALRDAGRLLGVTLTRSHLHAYAITYFTGQLAASRAGQAAARARFQQQIAGVDGLSVVGSAVAGTGLGAVVANATGAPLVTAGRKEAGSRHDES
jgi:oxygen-dependent protoporphyrinogen oxidase